MKFAIGSVTITRQHIADVVAWFAIKFTHVGAPVLLSLFMISVFYVFNAAWLLLRTSFAAVSVVIASISTCRHVFHFASGVLLNCELHVQEPSPSFIISVR